MSSFTTLPIVSLTDPRLGDSILHACTQTGFFYLSDHGIPTDHIDGIFDLARAFFALHQVEKRRYADRESNTGFTPLKNESLDPTTASEGDLKESFYLARLSTTASGATPEEVEHQPPLQTLPPLLDERREQVASFIESCKRVADGVLRGFAEALKLDPDYFRQHHRGALDRLRLIHYPPAEVAVEGIEGSIRAGAHSDYGSVTLLFQKDVGGLQVEQRQGEWIDVEPKAGCLVVNVADAIEFWTAGMFRSTLHRVVLPRSEAEAVSRYSMAYFCQPDEHCVLQPLSISHDLRRQVGDKAMSREEIEARLKRKGIDLDKKKEGGGGGEGEGPEGYLERVRMTGGEYLRRRLRATYR